MRKYLETMESQGTKLWFSFHEKVNLKFITNMVMRHDGRAQCIVVGDESVWHDKTWMTCFVDEEVAKTGKSDINFSSSCNIHEVPPGISVKVLPGADWDLYEIKIEPGDKVVLENLKIVRTMKGDSMASARNTNFESWASSTEAIRV